MEWFLWLWLGIFIVTLLFEFVTADMVSIWFSIAAIPSFLLALFSINPIIQIIVFVVFSIVLLVLTRPVVMKYFKTNEIMCILVINGKKFPNEEDLVKFITNKFPYVKTIVKNSNIFI